MTLKNWFLVTATVGHAAAARFAEASADDIRDVVAELGFGARLSLAQLEEVLALLDDGGESDDDEGDDQDEDDTSEDDDVGEEDGAEDEDDEHETEEA